MHNDLWLITSGALTALQQAHAHTLSAEQIEVYAARVAAAGDSRIMRVAGSTAEIAIEGPLTPRPSLFALLFLGATTGYNEIISALRAADADPAVRDIVLSIASPGGSVEGLFETLAALEATSKPIRVRAAAAHSAAYAIAAVAGQIEATTPVAMFGSIGVAAAFYTNPHVVDVASTGAPRKRPDVRTPEGQAIVRAELDQIETEFVGAIARGRGVSAARVSDDFGKGGSMTARHAQAAGMIDGIAPAPSRQTRAESPTDIFAARLEGESDDQYHSRMRGSLELISRPATSGPRTPPLTAEAVSEAMDRLDRNGNVRPLYPLTPQQRAVEAIFERMETTPLYELEEEAARARRAARPPRQMTRGQFRREVEDAVDALMDGRDPEAYADDDEPMPAPVTRTRPTPEQQEAVADLVSRIMDRDPSLPPPEAA